MTTPTHGECCGVQGRTQTRLDTQGLHRSVAGGAKYHSRNLTVTGGGTVSFEKLGPAFGMDGVGQPGGEGRRRADDRGGFTRDSRVGYWQSPVIIITECGGGGLEHDLALYRAGANWRPA